MKLSQGARRCLLAAVLFGASAPATSKLAGEMSSLVLAGLLYLGAAITVLIPALRRPPTREAIGLEWRQLTVAVVAGGALGPALLVAGIARTGASTASILLNLELVATVLLAATLFREHLGRRVIVGAALVGSGGVLLVWQPGADLSVGALLIAAATLAWGFDNGVTANIEQLAPEHVVFLKGAVAGSVNIGLGLVIVGVGGISLGRVAVALLIGAIGYGLSITLWVKGARDLGAARAQVLFATAPFIGVLIAWGVLGEAVSSVQVAAVILAAFGVGVSLKSAHDHEHTHDAVEHEHEHDHGDGHHDHHHGCDPDCDPDRPVHGPHVGGVVLAGHSSHRHRHRAVTHSHPHVPDLHHRHKHP